MASLSNALIAFLSRLFPRTMNRIKIHVVVVRERRQRPHPFALWTSPKMGPPRTDYPKYCAELEPAEVPFAPAAYVSWPGLVDRSYTGRHLPPNEAPIGDLPPPEEVVDTVFLRRGEMRPCKSTTALFCFFAQWFTDSFLRTDSCDRRRHTGNNEIDFCQIYGLEETTSFVLRARTGGLMHMRRDAKRDRDLLPFLVLREGLPDGSVPGDIDPRFLKLPYIAEAGGDPPGTTYNKRIESSLHGAPHDPSRWLNMYAAGLDRGNSTIFYTALSTMCVREHNRIARDLAKLKPAWDDDRLFETARLINIHNVLTIVVEDYINHIAGGGQTFKLDADFAEKRSWYRTNRISLEFNLLYRWHSLVPDEVLVDGEPLGHLQYRFNNALLEQSSPEHLINQASARPAGRIGLYNTPGFLARAEAASIALGREFRLQPFNAYCERFRHKPYGSIAELAGGDAKATADLERLYGGDVDKIDFAVGLFAEGRAKDDPDATLPPLLRTMVAVDAFTHILTNPVLSAQVRETAFGGDLMPFVTDTGGVIGLMRRNSTPEELAVPRFSMAGP